VESNEQFAAATQQCPETVFDVFEEHKEPCLMFLKNTKNQLPGMKGRLISRVVY